MIFFKRFSSAIVILVLILGAGVFQGCEGPSGPEGAEGPQGEVGPIGPAGEDGSQMYAGSGAPTSDIGDEGDYYLNTTTGEYYGPKDSSGWGNPIIVLMGDDGQDGADGEDGSQIFSGTGAPASSLGQEGDYYLDKSSFDLYGPKTASGWGSPINIKGADGNANVTRYIFQGHDFGNNSSLTLTIFGITNAEFKESAWLIYLANDRGLINSTFRYYPIPGEAIITSYSVSFGNINNINTAFFIEASGSGTNYERIEIVRIEATNIDDRRKQNSGGILPSGLDTSDYDAVAEHYGFKSFSH